MVMNPMVDSKITPQINPTTFWGAKKSRRIFLSKILVDRVLNPTESSKNHLQLNQEIHEIRQALQYLHVPG